MSELIVTAGRGRSHMGTAPGAVEFSAFVMQARPKLARIAYLMCGDWHRAEDVVQVVLMRLYPHWSRVNEQGDPHRYVRRALLHALIDEQRRPWRRERPVEITDAYLPAMVCAEPTEAAAVAALATLPPRQKAVIVLRYIEGMSLAEVALELRISEGTVKSQAARGLASLRHMMDIKGERQ